MINNICNGIFIGDDIDGVNVEAMKQNEIGMSLDLTELRIDVEVTPETINEVEDALVELTRMVKTGHNVLVFCNGGMDRAPFVVALWLSRTLNHAFQYSYYKVKKCRPQTMEHWDWYQHFKRDGDGLTLT